MIPWPFLFCQKPIVNAPVVAGVRQTFTDTGELPESSVSVPVSSGSVTEKLAVLLTVRQLCGTVSVRLYANVLPDVNGPPTGSLLLVGTGSPTANPSAGSVGTVLVIRSETLTLL